MATARRAKKKQLRSSLSSSLAAKTGDTTWDNQSNQETAPFLNELTELDLDGPSTFSSTANERKSKLRDFRRTTKKDKASTFGTQNDTSLNLTTDNTFETFPMNSDEEWK